MNDSFIKIVTMPLYEDGHACACLCKNIETEKYCIRYTYYNKYLETMYDITNEQYELLMNKGGVNRFLVLKVFEDLDDFDNAIKEILDKLNSDNTIDEILNELGVKVFIHKEKDIEKELIVNRLNSEKHYHISNEEGCRIIDCMPKPYYLRPEIRHLAESYVNYK